MSDIPVCYAGSKAVSSGTLTNVVTVGSDFGGSPAAFPVIAGETVIVCGGAGTHLPTSMNDSQSNGGYAQAAGTATSPAAYIWYSPNVAHPLHAAGTGFSADSVTVTYGVTGDGKQTVVMSVPGLLASPLDSGSAATASGTSATPSITSGSLAQAREFVVAVCTAAQAAGEAVWPAPWQVIATGVQTGAGSYCSVAVARNYTGTAAVTAAPTLPHSGIWSMAICGFKGAAASLRHWVGATVSTASFSDLGPGTGSTNWDASLEWDRDMGRDPCAKRLRVFYISTEGQFGTTAADDPQGVATNRASHPSLKPVLCIKPKRLGVVTPSVATSQIAAMCVYVTMLRNNDVRDLWWCLWNEMCYGGGKSSFGDGTEKSTQSGDPWAAGGLVPPPAGGWSTSQAAAHYQAYCNLYAPPLLVSGYLIGYKPLVASPTATILFFPGRAWGTGTQANNQGGCNDMVLDMYAGQPFSDPVGKYLFDVDTLTRGTLTAYQGQDFSFSPPIGLGFGEIGVTSGSVPDDTVPGWTAKLFTNVSATSFGGHALPVPGIIKLLQNRMAAGYPLAPMAWFSEKAAPAGNAIDSLGRIDGRMDTGDAWRAFYDALSVDAATTGVPPSVATASLPTATVGTPYTFTMAATSGTAPYTWAITSGGLPAGLTMTTAGVISGTPTAAGAPSVGFTVTDAASLTGSATLTLTVAGAALAVPSQSLPAPVVGVPYAAQLIATGGTPPDSWAIISGSLPAGLTLTSGGAITGTPTSAGTSAFTPQVTDHLAATASRAMSLTVTVPAFGIITTTMPPAVLGASYTGQVDTIGGTLPVASWVVLSGSLPPGLSIATPAAADYHLLDESGAQILDEAGNAITDESGP